MASSQLLPYQFTELTVKVTSQEHENLTARELISLDQPVRQSGHTFCFRPLVAKSRFVSTEPWCGYVSPRDSELADAGYRSWCNGRPLIEGVAEACAIAREEGRGETGSRER